MVSSIFLRADETAANTNVIIGLLVPPEEAEAASLREGAMLGVEQANQASGTRISLIVRGRTGQWGADGVEAARMVTDDGAQGLIAPPDGAASHLVLQVSGRTAAPVISLCADSSVSRTGVPWMARVVPQTTDEAKALFIGARSNHWVAVIPDGRAGRETSRDLKAAATASDCFLKKIVEVNSSFTNAMRLAGQILTNHPAAVLLWLDPVTAGKLAKSLRAAGFTGTLAGPGRLRSPDFLTAAGDASEGVVVPGAVLENEAVDSFQHFATAFRARFGHEPAATAMMSYDAAMLLIHILCQAGIRPAHELFPIGFSVTGASGILTFDSEGNRQVKFQLFEARGGRFLPRGTESNP